MARSVGRASRPAGQSIIVRKIKRTQYKIGSHRVTFRLPVFRINFHWILLQTKWKKEYHIDMIGLPCPCPLRCCLCFIFTRKRHSNWFICKTSEYCSLHKNKHKYRISFLGSSLTHQIVHYSDAPNHANILFNEIQFKMHFNIACIYKSIHSLLACMLRTMRQYIWADNLFTILPLKVVYSCVL